MPPVTRPAGGNPDEIRALVEDFLKGCKVTFYGLGVGQEGPTVEIIRAAWREWFSKAGAEFTAVIP